MGHTSDNLKFHHKLRFCLHMKWVQAPDECSDTPYIMPQQEITTGMRETFIGGLQQMTLPLYLAGPVFHHKHTGKEYSAHFKT